MAQHEIIDLAREPERLPAPQAPLSIVEFAIKNGAGIDTVERLVAMQERAMAREARSAYMAALAEMQGELPVIERNGRITIREKGNEAVVKQSTPYALWEDINEAIKPVLKTHGFALSFRTGVAGDGKLTVTGILSHRDGHQEETTMSLPHDSTGSKNAVQAVGSSTSYGKRYTASALLNLTSRGEDDDGKAGGAKAADSQQALSAEQIETLQKRLVSLGVDIPRFYQNFGIERLEDLGPPQFQRAMQLLDQREKAAGNKPANSPREQVRRQLQDSVAEGAK